MHPDPLLRPMAALFVVSLSMLVPARSAAQCVMEDFESFAVNAPVTTGVDGASIYVVGQSCGGSPPLYMRVVTSAYGDTFTSKVLLIDTGCPDFSDDYVRIIFDEAVDDVRFNLGPWAGTYAVRAYATVSGGAPVQTWSIVIPGTGFVDAHFPVKLSRPAGDIRRVEIEAAASGHEAIDNLMFGMDDTPPTVQIDDPAPLACISGEYTLTGVVCDEDGAYDRDRLESMRAWPSPQTDWTLIREYVGSPVCNPASLYTWDTTAPGVTDGTYLLRVEALNECGQEATASMIVHVDNAFESVGIDGPASGEVVGGSVCLEGTAWDAACFDHYILQYRPMGGGAWSNVDAAHPVYASPVTHETLGWWTAADNLPDGDYSVVVAGYSAGGATASHQILLTLDNTAPTAVIDSPGSCARLEGTVNVMGSVFDANIAHWRLDYYNPLSGSWVNINDDSDNIDGLLGTWDVTGLDPCFYLLRLRAVDRAMVNRCGARDPHVRDYYLPVAVGAGGATDLDFDGDTDLADYAIFQAGLTEPLP